MGMRQLRPDPARCLDERATIVVMLFDAGGDGEDVGIEDDVFGRNAGIFGQEPIGARADLDLAIGRFRLALFVKRHDHDGRSVPPYQPRLAQKLRLAFLKADGIDDGLALDATEPRLDHRPF